MDCADYKRWLSPYVDGLLNATERAQMEQHLASCARCQTELDSLRQMLQALRAMEQPTVPELLSGIHAKLHRESWWQILARRFTTPWPQSLPLHGLALATTVLLIVVIVGLPQVVKLRQGTQEYLRLASNKGLDDLKALPKKPLTQFEKREEVNGRGRPDRQLEEEDKVDQSRLLFTSRPIAAPEPAQGAGEGAYRAGTKQNEQPTTLSQPSSRDVIAFGGGSAGTPANSESFGTTTGLTSAIEDRAKEARTSTSGFEMGQAENLRVASNALSDDEQAEGKRDVRETALPLQVTIASDQASYILNAPILIEVTFTNVSGEKLKLVDLRLVGRSLAFATQVVTFQVADVMGHQSHISGYCGSIEDYFPGERTSWLNPHETITFKMVLNEPCPPGYPHVSYPVDQPGTYHISATYSGLVIDNHFTVDPHDTRLVSLTSNTISITVVEK